MSTILLLYGAASSGWYWHLVEPRPAAASHETAAPDLPADDPSAGLAEYGATALEALDGHRGEDVVVVAQSMAGFFAPVVAEGANPEVIFGHDVPAEAWAEAGRRLRDQTGRPFDESPR